MHERSSPTPSWRDALLRRPFLAFAAMAYACTWSFWAMAIAFSPETAIGALAFHAGGFGPLIAALAMVVLQRRSALGWLRGLFKWRAHVGWYAFVFLFPAFLVAVTSGLYVAAGGKLSLDLLPARLAAYAPVLVTSTLVGGGNEEPGWRGFGLPELQERHGPIPATLILGLVWALWHLPLLGLGATSANAAADPAQTVLATGVLLFSVTIHAFWYTWLINRTGSVLLCMILHGGYNTANGLLVLTPEETMPGGDQFLLLGLMTSVLAASVIALLLATNGRLGRR